MPALKSALKLALCLCVLTLGGCFGGSKANHQAEQFLRAYYERADLQKAKTLTSGMATFKIEKELALGGGQASPENTRSRSISFRRQDGSAHDQEDRKEFIYQMTLKIENRETIERLVRLTLVKAQPEKKWKVANFVEVDD